jgi:hypothetical protein
VGVCGGVGAWSGLGYMEEPLTILHAPRFLSAATACPRVGIYEILNDGNVHGNKQIDFSFLFSTIHMTWTAHAWYLLSQIPRLPVSIYVRADFAVCACPSVMLYSHAGLACSARCACFTSWR